MSPPLNSTKEALRTATMWCCYWGVLDQTVVPTHCHVQGLSWGVFHSSVAAEKMLRLLGTSYMANEFVSSLAERVLMYQGTRLHAYALRSCVALEGTVPKERTLDASRKSTRPRALSFRNWISP